MHDLTTSLLRERFIIHDPFSQISDSAPDKGFIVAASNRIIITLPNQKNDKSEEFIIRAQNMHSCLRMAAKLVQSFQQGGTILNRHNPFNWQTAWETAAVNEFEHSFNPQRWVSVYYNGKVIFSAGDHHPLLDVIEKCNSQNKGDYDSSIPLAEDAFKRSGKVVKIDYDAKDALSVSLEKLQGRCAVLLRGPTRTTKFNYLLQVKKATETLNIPQALSSCAAFLEGIQLAFMIGMNEEKIRRSLIDRHSPEEKQTREARHRLSRLNAEIANLESTYIVRYRPEKPEFLSIIADTEKLAQKIL
jgi:hypothetical protein